MLDVTPWENLLPEGCVPTSVVQIVRYIDTAGRPAVNFQAFGEAESDVSVTVGSLGTAAFLYLAESMGWQPPGYGPRFDG